MPCALSCSEICWSKPTSVLRSRRRTAPNGILGPVDPESRSSEISMPVDLLPDCHAGDDENQHSRCRSQNTHVRRYPFHPDLKLLLLGAHSGTGIVQEKLIVLVQSQGAAVNQQQDQYRRQYTPDDQQHHDHRHLPPRFERTGPDPNRNLAMPHGSGALQVATIIDPAFPEWGKYLRQTKLAPPCVRPQRGPRMSQNPCSAEAVAGHQICMPGVMPSIRMDAWQSVASSLL